MKAIKITDISQVENIRDRYFIRNCLTNNYLMLDEYENLIREDRLYAICTQQNSCFLVKKDKCFRVYYYINDTAEQMLFDIFDDFVLEILYRGEKYYPVNEIKYWEYCGFSTHLIRDQYETQYRDLRVESRATRDIYIDFATELEDALFACELFNSVFDPYSGDYISREQICQLLDERKILIAYKNNLHAGALHFYSANNRVWLGHVAVLDKYRGQYLGDILVDTYIKENMNNNKVRFSLWVQQQNQTAINMYQKKGFRYVNKSTISMLKLKK